MGKGLDFGRCHGANRRLKIGQTIEAPVIIGIDGIQPVAVLLQLLGMTLQEVVVRLLEVQSTRTLVRNPSLFGLYDRIHPFTLDRFRVEIDLQHGLSGREMGDTD